MKKWSNEKLERELCFARAARDETHQENLEWLAKVEAEASRRRSF